MDPSVSARFWAKVAKTPTCWLWSAACNTKGYGVFWDGSKQSLAHRLAYTDCVGLIPDGLVIDHLCRVKNCVRPDHLEPVTLSENVLRGQGVAPTNAAKTECIHGHPFDNANTYVTPDGRRNCRVCRKESDRRHARKS